MCRLLILFEPVLWKKKEVIMNRIEVAEVCTDRFENGQCSSTCKIAYEISVHVKNQRLSTLEGIQFS